MNDLLVYAETAGMENIRRHMDAAGGLAKEANTTLTLLLAISSGALAYAVKLAGVAGAISLFATMVVVTAYLFCLSAVLVKTCLIIGEFPNPANEPMNLYQKGFSVEQIREAELKNLQARIKQASQRNTVTAVWLNRVRLAATATPIVAIGAFIVAWGLCDLS